MTSKSLFVVTVFAIFTSLVTASSTFAAPRLYLEPNTLAVKQGQEFTLNLKIDVENNQVIGSDVTLNFASTDQELLGMDNANFFPEFTWASTTTGKIELHAFSSSIYQTKTGQGTIATLKFKAKKDNGSSTLSFGCSAGGNDTNILDVSGANILSCSNLNQALITYEAVSSSPSLSPSPSPTQSPASNPRPPTCTSLGLDPNTATIPTTVTLTCHGYDNDSAITGVEFVFGDGTTQSLTKNIGGSGSFSTTHSYTKAGSLKATCKLKDSQAVSNECSSTLTLSSPAPTPKPSVRPKAAASPTTRGKVLALVSEPSPTPTPQPTLSPNPPGETAPTNRLKPQTLWLLFGLLTLLSVGGYFIYRIFKSSTVDIPPQSL